MYADRLNGDLDTLLGTAAPKPAAKPDAGDTAAQEERLAKIKAAHAKLHGDVLPAFREAARAYLYFAKLAAVAHVELADLRAMTPLELLPSVDRVHLPDAFRVTVADVLALARGFVAHGLIDPNDELLDGMAG